MANFTPLPAFVGGVLIGLAATLFLLFNGRIAGISGILGGLLAPSWRESTWRIVFLLGIVLGALLVQQLQPAQYLPREHFPLGLLGLAGVLVGFGTRMGNGCTSGHAICGIARFSMRSIVATVTFMTTGFMTVYLMRHVIGVAL